MYRRTRILNFEPRTLRRSWEKARTKWHHTHTFEDTDEGT